jgi:hypothetical protein
MDEPPSAPIAKTKEAAIIGAFLTAGLLTPFLIGLTIGRITTPDWRKREEVMRYLQARVICKAPIKNLTGSPFAMASGPTLILYNNARRFRYDIDSDNLQIDEMSPSEIKAIPVQRNADVLAQELPKLIAPVSAVITTFAPSPIRHAIVSLASSNQRTTGFLMVAAIPLGLMGYWGYHAGYQQPDASSAAIQEIINNLGFWQGVERDYREHRETFRCTSLLSP